VAGITMKEWQRAPLQMMQEYCQAQKRPKPRYDQLSGGDRGGYRFRLVLQVRLGD
jgi:hypothetical protein